MSRLGEAIFGVLLLYVPWRLDSPILYSPCLYLFAGKFLFGPAISALYNDTPSPVPTAKRSLRVAQLGLVVVLATIPAALLHTHLRAATSQRVEIRGKELYLDGHPFTVKGMHYGPWRPGTGPGKGYPYPGPQDIDSDLKLIRSLNVNTILVYDPPTYVLDVAEKHGLMVLYTFDINWLALGTPEDATARASILKRVGDYRQKPALLGWALGNEIPTAVVEKRGRDFLRTWLLDLYRSIKASDPQHPVTHSNWPITKDLDLGFLDIVSFNVYPLWPPEVVAAGYGNYIEQSLQPIAGKKPLLITEFGADSLEAGEAGQARLLRDSWEGLRKAGACGGVVFEFADEWWKNYDNPKRPGDWWDRQPAPDDEKRHDLDPEEYYGVMTAERQPKPAASAVREMFSTGDPDRTVPTVLILMLILLAFAGWTWARRGR
jgi:hypothetical protein